MTTTPDITYKNIYDRLIAQLPPWFGNQQFVDIPPPQTLTPTTNFNNVLWAFLITAFDSYYQMKYDFQQLRIGQYELDNPNSGQPKATGDNLNLIAQDFFGNGLPRRPNESDDNYRNRILSNVMRLKATRSAMLDALTNLVTPSFVQAGIPVVPPIIYEGWFPFDNGGYNDYQALAFGSPGGVYNGVGAYGEGNDPYTCTITVFLPSGNGLGGYPGLLTQGETITWGAGFGDPSITPSTPAGDIPPQWYGSFDLLNFYVTESDIRNCINLTKVLGTLCNLIIIYVN